MKNLWIISYDISNPKRLRKVAKFLEGYGTRIQESVFKVYVNDRDIEKIKWELTKKIEEIDSIFYFRFCNSCAERIQNQNPKLFQFDKDLTFRIF
ncbi:MAG: CRISPR-associated endonuclease Cas2 [Leptospiraceae bacterium]|nr:CRISPR-associated endonuclease Cas2 [Leptospiraceae bacterium]MCK6382148.1 CRISPR-associated endonuclease Cas2 [Leptospiraceae bacterium]NUM40431.1 CRISPR-associated endonuclease Cas2 [Leptospiraceae bacterium]